MAAMNVWPCLSVCLVVGCVIGAATPFNPNSHSSYTRTQKQFVPHPPSASSSSSSSSSSSLSSPDDSTLVGSRSSRLRSPKCTYSIIVKEVDASSCPQLLYPHHQSTQPDGVQGEDKADQERPAADQPAEPLIMRRAYLRSFEELQQKVEVLEAKLLGEMVENRELKNSVLIQEQRLKKLDTSLNSYVSNFSRVQTDVKDIRATLTKHREFYKSIDNKLAGVMLDVAEVNNLMAAQKKTQRDDDLDSKSIAVQSVTKINSCSVPVNGTKYKDCEDLYHNGHTRSGVYYITPIYAVCPIPVYCDMDTPPGGWMVIQRRIDGTTSFDHNWLEYREGFGDVTQEFWLGNDNLFLLTNQLHYELRIDLWDFYGSRVYAEYRHFKVDGERDKYQLHVTNHSGTAPDGMTNHNMMYFSTPDRDQDSYPEYHCAKEWSAGWWFSNCWFVILNGQWYNHTRVEYRGISWNDWKAEQLKRTEMKIRPSGF